jgi:peptidyl-prolyl cis-trans isomerase SurA
VRAGEAFEAVAKEVSEDGNRAEGGMIGLRPADRLPDVFVNAVRGLRSGDVAPELLRTGAGFHLLKLVERRDAGNFTGPADAGSPHPAAHLGPAAARPGDAPPGRHQAEDRRRHPIVRAGGA